MYCSCQKWQNCVNPYLQSKGLSVKMQVTAGVAIPALASMGIKSSNWNIIVALVKEVKASITIVTVTAVFMASYADVD